MRYAYAVYKTADSSTTLQMSNRSIVEHHEQMGERILRKAGMVTAQLFSLPIRIRNISKGQFSYISLDY